MSVIIRALGFANGVRCPHAGQWLRGFDFEAHHGQGFGDFTTAKAKAKRFASFEEALTFWKTQSTTLPLRPDGKPNRPLTALTITFDQVEP